MPGMTMTRPVSKVQCVPEWSHDLKIFSVKEQMGKKYQSEEEQPQLEFDAYVDGVADEQDPETPARIRFWVNITWDEQKGNLYKYVKAAGVAWPEAGQDIDFSDFIGRWITAEVTQYEGKDGSMRNKVAVPSRCKTRTIKQDARPYLIDPESGARTDYAGNAVAEDAPF